MTYEEFKKEFRLDFPTASNRLMREMHELVSPEHYTIADTPPPTKQGWWNNNQKEEGINPMNFDNECPNECTMCVPSCVPAPRSFGIKKAAVANAQVINAVPVEATQRDYAIERIKAIGEKHAQSLLKQFNMNEQRPQTAVALIDAIKNGNYTLDQGKLTDFADGIEQGYYNNEFGIRWGKPADKDGYKAAKAVLKAAAQKALDGATLKPFDQLEAVIDDFEAWTLTLH